MESGRGVDGGGGIFWWWCARAWNCGFWKNWKFWNFCKVFGSQTVTLKQTNDTQTAWNQNFQKIQNSDSFTYEPISSFSGLLHDQRQKFEHFAKEKR